MREISKNSNYLLIIFRVCVIVSFFFLSEKREVVSCCAADAIVYKLSEQKVSQVAMGKVRENQFE